VKGRNPGGGVDAILACRGAGVALRGNQPRAESASHGFRQAQAMLNEHPIFVIFVVAVVAPLLAQTRAGSYVPVVVFEVLFGILIGPHGLGVID
jgi:hypothetical protein